MPSAQYYVEYAVEPFPTQNSFTTGWTITINNLDNYEYAIYEAIQYRMPIEYRFYETTNLRIVNDDVDTWDIVIARPFVMFDSVLAQIGFKGVFEDAQNELNKYIPDYYPKKGEELTEPRQINALPGKGEGCDG